MHAEAWAGSRLSANGKGAFALWASVIFQWDRRPIMNFLKSSYARLRRADHITHPKISRVSVIPNNNADRSPGREAWRGWGCPNSSTTLRTFTNATRKMCNRKGRAPWNLRPPHSHRNQMATMRTKVWEVGRYRRCKHPLSQILSPLVQENRYPVS